MSKSNNGDELSRQYPNLASREMCTGCSACAESCAFQCLKMKEDKYGFSYPRLSESQKCIGCRSCERACPILSGGYTLKDKPVVYAAYTNNEEIRNCSSSGGIFTEIAKYVINNNGSVCGAVFDDQYNVKHVIVTDTQQLSSLRRAKYAESKLNNVFTEIKQQLLLGKLILFAGTPCQVAGLKSYLKEDFQNLICIDFVCRGIPAPEAWKKYIRYRAKKDAWGKNPVEINMRSKKTGWSKYQYSVQFIYDNKEYFSVSRRDPFMKALVDGTLIRDSCTNCLFKGMNRASDITLGDFWGIWNINPAMDDNRGTSVLLINTEKGCQIFDRIKNNISYHEERIEDVCKYNTSINVSTKRSMKINGLEIVIEKGFGYYLIKRKITRLLDLISRRM